MKVQTWQQYEAAIDHAFEINLEISTDQSQVRPVFFEKSFFGQKTL